MGGNETEIDFVLVGKNNSKYSKKCESHPLGVATSAGGNRHRQKKVVKNKQTIRSVWKLKENNIKTKLQERVKELVDVDAANLWNTFKNSMLQTCD